MRCRPLLPWALAPAGLAVFGKREDEWVVGGKVAWADMVCQGLVHAAAGAVDALGIMFAVALAKLSDGQDQRVVGGEVEVADMVGQRLVEMVAGFMDGELCCAGHWWKPP